MAYVSRIELRGFKSFGNSKVSLPLSKGLTAIVGPNGSGKSNVVDALCFVLGEMSAKTMRAERFSDLLFSGGNGKRPAPFAEVSLHFDNRDNTLPINSETVIISRRADRSGKSVYRINKRRASRQEIVDLLARSMSSPGGYNFIMQGDIDRFIKMDPLERRAIIDDFAGIAEYDEKKRKSIAELQRVESNLSSMDAVLGEVSAQMEKLRSERESAIRYRELKQELGHAKATLLTIRHTTYRRKLSQLQNRIKVKERKLQELRDRRRKILEEIEANDQEVGRLEKLVEKKQNTGAFAETERIRERIKLLSQMLNLTAREREKIVSEIDEIDAYIKKSGLHSSSDFFKKTASISQRFETLRARFNLLLQNLNSSRSRTETEKVLGELHEVLNDIRFVLDGFSEHLRQASELLRKEQSLGRPNEAGSQLWDRLISLKAVRSQQEHTLERLQQQVKKSQVELDKTTALAKEERDSISALRREEEKLRQRVRGFKEKAKHLEGTIEQLAGELQACKVDEAALLPQLKNIEEELQRIKVQAVVASEVDRAKLERKVGNLEAELEALGPVNFRAIQDFRNAERRYNSEKLKHDKLVAEKQALLDFMREIDEKKKEVFMRTFNEFSRYFSEIFGELSPGGIGRLVLESEENPFEGGLNIDAKPAGKNAKVRALSGGERALTALAFIFALQRFRPTALYVLDEIDAHLDPRNLRRVAEFIRRSSRESQVIIVTLHDSMMSAADRLFGVTMDKSGVSRLLSVELAGLAG